LYGCAGGSFFSDSGSSTSLTPFLKPLIACPRLAPSWGSFEGPKKSSASASTTRISPNPSLIHASAAVTNANPRPRQGEILSQTKGEGILPGPRRGAYPSAAAEFFRPPGRFRYAGAVLLAILLLLAD